MRSGHSGAGAAVQIVSVTPMTSTGARIALSAAALGFVAERHVATLTTLRADGTPHMVPIGFTWDQDSGIARIITSGDTVKARNVRRTGYAAVSQVDGARWLTLEGPAEILTDPDAVTEGERRYAERYRVPRINPARVVIAIRPTRLLTGTALRD